MPGAPATPQADPRVHARRLGRWLWVGYAYPFGLLALLLAGAALFLWFLSAADPDDGGRVLVLGGFIAFGFVALGVHVLRLVWKGQPPFDLPELAREDAPLLFARVGKVRRELGAPMLGSIRLIDSIARVILLSVNPARDGGMGR